jgi:hypothetical protein
MPDFTIKVSPYAFMPDITMGIVNSPKEANLILVDDLSQANMRVCKEQSSFGSKTIMVSDTAFMPDITVQLLTHAVMADYKIFIASERFTNEEAAALFALIWEANRRKAR